MTEQFSIKCPSTNTVKVHQKHNLEYIIDNQNLQHFSLYFKSENDLYYDKRSFISE